MNRNLLSLTMVIGFTGCFVAAQERTRPQNSDGNPGPLGLHLLPRGSEDTLNLSAEQRKQLADLEAESKTKLESILTADQKQKLTAPRPPAPPRDERNRRPGTPATVPGDAAVQATPRAATDAPAKPLPAGVTRQPVVFSGGHDTVPVDHGRPVVLIAAALGVKNEVFREAFSHVHPAGPGSGGPSDADARANKAALMNALGKFGVTDDRLNTVSNFYRYPPGSRNLWKNKPATANALVKDGAIVGYEIGSGGYGYTTPPTVSVPGFPNASANIELSFGKIFETNGAVSALTTSKSR